MHRISFLLKYIKQALVKPCILSADKQVLVPQAAERLELIPYSIGAVQRRIENKAIDVEQ